MDTLSFDLPGISPVGLDLIALLNSPQATVKQIAAQGRDVEEFIPAVIYEDIMKRLYKPLAEV